METPEKPLPSGDQPSDGVEHTVMPLRKRSSSGRLRMEDAAPLRRSKSSVNRYLDSIGNGEKQFVEPALWANIADLSGFEVGTDTMGSFVFIKAGSRSGQLGDIKIYSL